MRMRRQSVVLNSRILYSLFTQERSLALVYVAVPRGSAARMSTTEADMKRAADHRGPPSSRSYAHSCSGVEWEGRYRGSYPGRCRCPRCCWSLRSAPDVDGYRNALDGTA